MKTGLRSLTMFMAMAAVSLPLMACSGNSMQKESMQQGTMEQGTMQSKDMGDKTMDKSMDQKMDKDKTMMKDQ